MSEYINLYNGDVSKDTKTGEIISQDGMLTNPIGVSLNASEGEVKYVKCAIRCEEGYKSTRTAISVIGLTQEKWQIALDNNYTDSNVHKATFASSLVISDEITDNNMLIWFKISSSTDEKPRRDTSVSIKIDANIVTV